MPDYRIENARTGYVLGVYSGETPEDAIHAMDRDAGAEESTVTHAHGPIYRAELKGLCSHLWVEELVE